MRRHLGDDFTVDFQAYIVASKQNLCQKCEAELKFVSSFRIFQILVSE